MGTLKTDNKGVIILAIKKSKDVLHAEAFVSVKKDNYQKEDYQKVISETIHFSISEFSKLVCFEIGKKLASNISFYGLLRESFYLRSVVKASDIKICNGIPDDSKVYVGGEFIFNASHIWTSEKGLGSIKSDELELFEAGFLLGLRESID